MCVERLSVNALPLREILPPNGHPFYLCIPSFKTTTEQSQQNLHAASTVSFIQDSKSLTLTLSFFFPTISIVLQETVLRLLQVSFHAAGSHKSEPQEHQLLATLLHWTLWLENLFSTFPPHDELDRRVSWRRDESLMETFVVRLVLLFVVLETFKKKKKMKKKKTSGCE